MSILDFSWSRFFLKYIEVTKMTEDANPGPSSKDNSESKDPVHPKLRQNLEKMEMESPGCVVPFEVYGQLLAIYLHDNDL